MYLLYLSKKWTTINNVREHVLKNENEQSGLTCGTATVFKIEKNKCYVITAAYNIRKQIKECKKYF